MYTLTAAYYDTVYDFKDYQQEAAQVTAVARENLRSGGNRLLDVACGTGRHLECLRADFEVEGLDLNKDLLAIARTRNPGIPFHLGDMMAFQLDRQFDVVACLFSSIGYTRTLEGLARAVGCMAGHLVPGGVLIIEPWFSPGAWHPNTVHAQFIDEPELKIARINTSYADGRLSTFDLHYLIGTPTGTEHLVERHELGLFETSEMREALLAAGLDVSYDPEGLTGRGLFVGRRPFEA